MHNLLENILETKSFATRDSGPLQVHSGISKGQCEFLQQLIRANQFNSSVEVGFAFGISTLAIIEEIARNGGSHTVIDKYELSAWKGAGLDLVEQAGFGHALQFHEEFCYIVLPELLAEGKKFDFAFIDSTKQLDWLLVDFFYIDKMLAPGGMVVFDDVTCPGIRKLLRYIAQFPSYQVHATFPGNLPPSRKRKIVTALKYLPYSEKYIKENVIRTDFDMGLNTHCVALRKKGDDKRNWDWHVDF
ncbi:O-methyltransferase [Paraflavitalea pollutisoli]|uniref:O-methyltransferase n=1 Tax=Paraflavitalea pollutisoli TaxID=3034143 RepID=UPI0023EB1EC9|nr:class I SAM-dependent methyltransferase [Paraflavitalea sp. H1-2-19X]